MGRAIENDDLLLINRFKDGDESAFDILFHNLYQPMCLFAQRIVNDSEAAEDLVQEIFVKLWEKHTNFDQLSAIRSFLYLSIKNSCFNYLEKVKVREKHQQHILSNDLPSERTILNGIIEAEVVHNVISVIETLPAQCRKVIRMTFFDGLSPKEIAEQMGITVSTVNNQKMRGLSILKNKLSRQDFFLFMLVIVPELLKR